MSRLMSLFWVLAMAALLQVMACCTSWNTAKEVGTKRVTAAASPGAVGAETSNGGVEIVRGEVSEIAVDATFRAETRQRLAEMDVSVVPDGAGGMKVVVKWPADGRRGSEGCSLKVVTPGASGVTVRTGNGGVTVRGLGGQADLRTTNGSVEVADQGGGVVAETSNGAIVVRGAKGDVHATSSNGTLDIAGVEGPVRCSTSNGAILVKQAGFKDAAFDLTTSNGSVTVEVAADFGGTVAAETTNGSVSIKGAKSVEATKTTGKGAYGESPVRGVIRTSNGRVEVSRAGGGGA